MKLFVALICIFVVAAVGNGEYINLNQICFYKMFAVIFGPEIPACIQCGTFKEMLQSLQIDMFRLIFAGKNEIKCNLQL